TVRIGDQFHAAVVGSALLVSNKEKVLHAAIDLGSAGPKDNVAGLATLKQARQLLPPQPLAWAWVNMERVSKVPQIKAVFAIEEAKPAKPEAKDPDKKEPPKKDKKNQGNAASPGLFFGPWIDAMFKCPFACAGLYQENDSFLVTLRIPQGRESMYPRMAM